MALTGPDVAILGMADRWAYQKGAAVYAGTGGTDNWTRVDASADETFENRVKGQNLTDLDTAMGIMPFGEYQDLGVVLASLSTYGNTDLGLGGFNGYLNTRKFRLSLRAAQIWQEKYATGFLSIANIGSLADGGASAPGLTLGSMIGDGGGTGSFTAGTDMSETTNGPSPILARVTKKGLADWAMTVTVKQATGVTPVSEDVVITVGASVAVGTTYIVGETAQDENNAAGQKAVKVAATDQFASGQTVLLSQWTGDIPDRVWVSQEIGTIDTIQNNVSITMEDNLLHSYTTAGGRTFAYPCYIGVSDVDDATGADGTNLDAVTFYPAPDRALKL